MKLDGDLSDLANDPHRIPDVDGLLIRAEHRRRNQARLRLTMPIAAIAVGVGALFAFNHSTASTPIAVVDSSVESTSSEGPLNPSQAPSSTTTGEHSDPRIAAECPEIELTANRFHVVDAREGWSAPTGSSPVERLHSTWEAPGETGVITVALPGSTPIGDEFDLAESLNISGFDATLAPNVHHSPDPWRLMVFLPFDEPGCAWMTIMAWEGAGQEELRRFAEDLDIQIPQKP